LYEPVGIEGVRAFMIGFLEKLLNLHNAIAACILWFSYI